MRMTDQTPSSIDRRHILAAGAVGAAGITTAQPGAGEAVAFSAICTPQGCIVAPQGDEIACPCHGSVYESPTGKNVGGPAPRPLAKVEVRVVDAQVVPA
jgi:Rieske Fe-S protein